MQNVLIYQPKDNIHSVNECRFSLLNLLSVYNLKPPNDLSIVIYSNKPAMFEAYAPFFDEFEIIEKLANNRVEIISELKHTNNSNVIFCSTDSFLVTPLHSVFENLNTGTLYLYEPSDLKDQEDFIQLQKIKTYLSSNKISINNQTIEYPQNIKFYNTQSIGFNIDSVGLIKNIYELTQKLLITTTFDTAEKFAFAFYLLNHKVQYLKGRFKDFKNLPEFKELLQIFFKKNEEESIPNLVKLSHHLHVETIYNDKLKYAQLPFYKKWINVLVGKEWSIKKYQNRI